MKNTPPGEDVDNIVQLSQADMASSDWSDLLGSLAAKPDKNIYARLFNHFAPKVKAYILRLGVGVSAAEEVTQEVMLSVWRKAHMYHPEKAAASTWIFTLARNQSIDWMRKQKYPQYSLDEWSETASESGQGEQEVLSDRVAKAISQLPEKQAQVIYMSYFEGRSHGDIASRLDIPLGSVKSRIRLASEKLKQIWGGENYEH
ncbi:sigma-70 family RNA polymerase sigma factor [uncultured Amphritea sp.]|uniref:sigma-70 family RNA polymerase sigma factor n=1 Tax=uncultured Amphritea sp. TaxID=981605 RepID=UPI00262A7DB5|nr:sigma-70 family RNA polymerase sigma factor [uncultured Amphritea sp.]